jgi:DNA-binding MarR family transcriptional regulator
MITNDLQDQLSLTLLRASLKGKYGMTEVAEANDITLMQAMTLCLLEPDQGVRMSSVSSYLSCDPSSVTGIVEHLVSRKFIERKECETDRRSKLISLTPSGMELRRKLLQIVAEKRFPAFDTLSDQEANELIRLINKATDGASLPMSATK